MTVLVPLLMLMAATPIRATHVHVEGHASNLSVDQKQPLIEWQVGDSGPGTKQSAFQVELKGSGIDFISPKLFGDRTSFEYDGKPLLPRTDYTVRVRLWDKSGGEGPWSAPIPFRTLMLGKDWNAKWIRDASPATEYKQGQNGFHSQLAKAATELKWAEIDLRQSRAIDRVVLHPAEPIDWKEKVYGLLFPVQFRIEIDGKEVYATKSDLPMPTEPLIVTFPATEGRKLRIVVTKLRERDAGNFGWALAELQAFGDGQVLSQNAAVTASDSLQNQLWSTVYLTNGVLVSQSPSGTEALPAPMLRKEFELASVPKRALTHIAVLGAYQLFVNGKRVDKHELAPDWTDYFTRVGVQTFDLAPYLKKGSNAIALQLGDSWYAGRIGMSQGLHPDRRPRAVYGRVPMARIEVELPDGPLFSDGTWQSSILGPIRASDLYDGEFYDATMEQAGWTSPGFSGSGWKPVAIDTPASEPELDAQTAEPVAATLEVKPISQSTDKNGRIVLDFGQNLVGRAKFKFKGARGDRVVVRYAEMLNEDGTAYFDNLRGAPQIDTFVLDGTDRWYTTHFTYHGYRYASIDLGGKPVSLEGVASEVFHTSAPETASFACSNPMFERLWQNIVWTQRANLMSTPTDCPQRDERLGWMGDIHAYAQTACYIMDMRNFWRKWILDVRDAQADDGRYPDFAPHPYGKNRHFTGVPGWGDAGVIAPLTAYRNYEDEREIRRMLESAGRWLDWIESKNPNHLWLNNRHNDYGDWLNGDTLVQEGWPKQGAECPKDVFATLMWFQSAKSAEEMANAIGDKGSAGKFASMANGVQAAFVKAYVDGDEKIKGDTQAGYAIALGLDILPEAMRAKAFDHLLRAIERAKNHISTGFHSTHHLMQVLTRYGRSDIAYMLLSNKTFPGWGYSIEQGATTIWERWDGYVKGRGFQDPGMNSFNHWAFGSVGEWMMEGIIGIKLGEPGWRKFTIDPQIGGGLTWAKGHFDSPSGRIMVSWKASSDKLDIEVDVPPNAVATFVKPNGWQGSAPSRLESGHHRIHLER